MSTALKCPGPSCTFVFDPSTIPAGAVLTCPRCGIRFTLGNPAAPPAAGGYTGLPPGYPAPGGVPGGYPAAPTNQAEAAFGDMTPETAKADGEEGPRLPVRESALQTILLVAVAAVAVAAAGIAVWYKMTTDPNTKGETASAYRYKDVNLGFDPPPRPWAADPDAKNRLGPPFFEAYRRENPEAYMAFGARDFKDHEPRPGELEDVLTAALAKVLERDTLKPYEFDGAKDWMGRVIRGFRFAGLARGAGSVEGEALAVSYKGVGYWFLAWTGANEIYQEQKSAFAVGRSGCKLLGGREDWKATIPPVAVFKNAELGYTILDSEHVWHPIDDEAEIKAQDPMGDKYLVYYDDRKPPDRGVRAQLVVAVLDVASDNPVRDARAHVEARINALADLQGKFKVTEYTDELEGDPTNPAEGNAPVLLLKATSEQDPKNVWLYAVSGVSVGQKLVVLYARGAWPERRHFDTKFIQIAKSLRADR